MNTTIALRHPCANSVVASITAVDYFGLKEEVSYVSSRDRGMTAVSITLATVLGVGMDSCCLPKVYGMKVILDLSGIVFDPYTSTYNLLLVLGKIIENVNYVIVSYKDEEEMTCLDDFRSSTYTHVRMLIKQWGADKVIASIPSNTRLGSIGSILKRLKADGVLSVSLPEEIWLMRNQYPAFREFMCHVRCEDVRNIPHLVEEGSNVLYSFSTLMIISMGGPIPALDTIKNKMGINPGNLSSTSGSNGVSEFVVDANRSAVLRF